MFRLAVVTCLVLGSALAKPPPSKDWKNVPVPLPLREGPEPVPFQGILKPVPAKEGPDPIPFQEGSERVTYTLATGRYYFTSPNHPNSYTNNYDRSFTVKGDSSQDITITCDPFRMERHSTPSICGWDFLSINEQKYCGTSAPPTTTVSELRIVIKTDYSVTDSGFYCLVTVASGSGATTTTAAPPSGDCQCGLRQNSRIVGGTEATAGQFPWQAGLVSRGGTRTFCGGSVINNRYVLTAAHCTDGNTAGNIQVMLGDLNIGSTDAGEQRFSVVQIIEHPQYADPPWTAGWDFTLLKLDREITFSSTISPVCLPDAGQSYADATAIASGYGRVGDTLPQATILQHVQMSVWSQSRCLSHNDMGSYIKDSMICAGGSSGGGQGVCMGDSGGSLVTEVSGRFRLIGVPSFVIPCALANIPDVFARVTDALPWIASNTADAITCSP